MIPYIFPKHLFRTTAVCLSCFSSNLISRKIAFVDPAAFCFLHNKPRCYFSNVWQLKSFWTKYCRILVDWFWNNFCCLSASVTSKMSIKVAQKWFSKEKLKILTTLLKLPKNVGSSGKIIVATGFEKLPKVQ